MPRKIAQTLALGAGALAAAAITRRWLAGRSFCFRDQVVWITGGSRGLGFVMARQILRAGGKVAICGRDEDTLHRAYALLRQAGPVFAHRCDITNREEAES